MKKIMILAVAAIAMVACTKTYEVVETSQEQSPIGFGTWTENMTKAESRVQGTGTFLSGDTFNVYGYKTVSAASTNVFTGDVVTAKGATAEDGLTVTAWEYSPLRFWDATASSYTFFAVSPSGKVATAPVDNGVYTGLFVSTPILFGGHDNDILVATKKVVEAAVGTPKYSNTPVEIQFNHVASLVDVKVKKDAALPAGATLKITAASLTSVQNKGTFTVSSYNGSNLPVIGATAYGWAVHAESIAATYAANAALPLTVSEATTVYDGDHVGTTTGTAQDLLSSFVLMPQDLSAGSQKLHLEYKIVTQEAATEPEVVEEIATSFTADVNIKDFVVTDKNNNDASAVSSSWNPATHYTYTVTIGANAITFTASINDWTSVSGYNYLIN